MDLSYNPYYHKLGHKKSNAVNFFDMILFEVSLIILDGKTILGVPASNKVSHKFHHLYIIYLFVLKFTLTMVEPLSATKARTWFTNNL